MRFTLTSASGIVPALIKFQTRSTRSHARLVFSDDTVIEATWPRVRFSIWTFDEGELYSVETTKEQEKIMWEFAKAQIGKPYDLTMVVRFVTRQQATRASSGKWFCSELVFAAFQKAGINLLERIEPWAVSPELLRVSPLAKRIK